MRYVSESAVALYVWMALVVHFPHTLDQVYVGVKCSNKLKIFETRLYIPKYRRPMLYSDLECVSILFSSSELPEKQIRQQQSADVPYVVCENLKVTTHLHTKASFPHLKKQLTHLMANHLSCIIHNLY